MANCCAFEFSDLFLSVHGVLPFFFRTRLALAETGAVVFVFSSPHSSIRFAFMVSWVQGSFSVRITRCSQKLSERRNMWMLTHVTVPLSNPVVSVWTLNRLLPSRLLPFQDRTKSDYSAGQATPALAGVLCLFGLFGSCVSFGSMLKNSFASKAVAPRLR